MIDSTIHREVRQMFDWLVSRLQRISILFASDPLIQLMRGKRMPLI